MNDIVTTPVELSELDLGHLAAGSDKDNNFAVRGPRGAGAFRTDNFAGARGPRGGGVVVRT